MTTKSTKKSPEQKANENVIVVWFAVIVITAAVVAGLMTRPSNVNHNASSQAVHQVQIGNAEVIAR